MRRKFPRSQEKLKLAFILIFSSTNESFVVYCDSSLMGLRGVLMQNHRVVAYASRKLKVHKRNYLTHDL